MILETTCCNVTLEEWRKLMKGTKPLSYKWLVSRIKRNLPQLYKELALDFPNPYADACYKTETHYILTHSAIEYFIRK